MLNVKKVEVATSVSFLKVAESFFQFFSRETPRRFTYENMKQSYSEAIKTHHPRAQELDVIKITSKVSSFINNIFDRLDFLRSYPEKLMEEMQGLHLQTTIFSRLWFPELIETRLCYRQSEKQKRRIEYLRPYFQGKSLVDIGCGSGELLNYLASDKSLRLGGVEIGDFRGAKSDFDLQICNLSESKALSQKQYETGLILNVLHHVSADDAVIKSFLFNARSLGIERLIIEEDILIERQYRTLKIEGLEEIEKLSAEQARFLQYLNLNLEDQHAITSMADFLSNGLFGNYQMPYPFGFRSIGQWLSCCKEGGWDLNRMKILGFQPGNFNQVCHALFILDRK